MSILSGRVFAGSVCVTVGIPKLLGFSGRAFMRMGALWGRCFSTLNLPSGWS